MEVLRGIDARPDRPAPAVVTIGAFAVVHRGHRALLTRVVEEAGRLGAQPAAVTFARHPLETIAPDRAPCSLSTLDQRLARIESVGMQWALVIDFTPKVASLRPEEFVKRALVETLRACKVVVGEDFRFGYHRSGDVAVLSELGRRYRFEVEAFGLVEAPEGGKLSTGEIRRLVGSGEVAEAARLLGYNHAVAGVVERGDGRGHEIGFPTANLRPEPRTCLPGAGIYTGWWREGERRLPGAVYVGDKPTLRGAGTGIEIHILDHDEDLYGRRGEIEFGVRLRGDRAFGSVDELAAQIRRDVAEARHLLAEGAPNAGP